MKRAKQRIYRPSLSEVFRKKVPKLVKNITSNNSLFRALIGRSK